MLTVLLTRQVGRSALTDSDAASIVRLHHGIAVRMRKGSMDIFVTIAGQFWHYVVEVFPYLALGFLFSGVIQVFLPSDWVARHLGGRGLRPLLYATITGVALPICCVGSLPVAVSLHGKGARLGPVLAFLVATPATSLPALLVSYGLLGLQFTVFIFAAVIVLGVAVGVIGNRLRYAPAGDRNALTGTTDPVCGMQVDSKKRGAISTEHEGRQIYFCCNLCNAKFASRPSEYPARCANEESSCKPGGGNRVRQALQHAFVTMPRDIGPEILIGLLVAAVVAAVTPIGNFIGAHLSGSQAYLVALPLGIMMYTCSTASVPFVHALMSQGLNPGAGMLLLIVGPVTSWSTMLVLRKEFGVRILATYLAAISGLSVAAGIIYSLL